MPHETAWRWVKLGETGLEIRRINERISVSPQIAPDDIAAIKAAGFVTIINNRPDGEAPEQPKNSEIEEACRAAGLDFVAIPLGRDGITPDMIEKTHVALENASGPVFCFCRSGTRSATLWALSQAGVMHADDIIAAAADAGYDLSHLIDKLT